MSSSSEFKETSQREYLVEMSELRKGTVFSEVSD
jgi:hypothetical protein